MRFRCFGISPYASNAMKSGNPHSGIYEAKTSRCLDLNGGNPACNQGGDNSSCGDRRKWFSTVTQRNGNQRWHSDVHIKQHGGSWSCLQQRKEKLNGAPDFSHGKEVRLKDLDGKKKEPLACELSTRGG